MEGLIPFVYRAIVQYKNGREGVIAAWLDESPSAQYMRLPAGDSDRFQISERQLFQSDSIATTPPPSSSATTTTTQIILSTGVQSPVCRLTSRRLVA